MDLELSSKINSLIRSIKPCPNCGFNPELGTRVKPDGSIYYDIICYSPACSAISHVHSPDIVSAIESWNELDWKSDGGVVIFTHRGIAGVMRRK